MATVTGYTALRMKAIEDASIVSGEIIAGNLILTRFDGGTVDAGPVTAGEFFIPLDQKAAVNGVATLDGSGLIPTEQLPPIALGETFIVTSQAAMLALTAQRGDVAIRTDLDPDGFFLLLSDSPGTLADWKQILAPGSVVSVDGLTGAISLSTLYAPKTPVVGTALATTGAVALDMAALDGTYQSIALTGDPTFTSSNRAAGRTVTIKLVAGGSARTLVFPAWIFIGAAAPATLASGKVGILTVTFFDNTDAAAVAAWAAQP